MRLLDNRIARLEKARGVEEVVGTWFVIAMDACERDRAAAIATALRQAGKTLGPLDTVIVITRFGFEEPERPPLLINAVRPGDASFSGLVKANEQ